MYLPRFENTKNTGIEIQVIGRGGFTARFSLRRRSQISRVRAAVAQLFADPTARFFWLSANHFQEESGLENVVDQDTPYLLCMGNRETVYQAGHIVVVHEIGAFKALEIHVWHGSNVHPGVPAQILPPGIYILP
ncbi:hypothetical protein B0H14DRAFT_2581159 [Mycena olivaceomarginata]|nr:hypothetical protein B0H14DRAFT_2581159 [Mycena olivaceomarginata]